MRNFIRRITPRFLLEAYRRRKKNTLRKTLLHQKEQGKALTQKTLEEELYKIGIRKRETLLVHSSLSQIGYVDGGAKTVLQALLNSVGKDGHILMPNSPNASFQLDYIKSLPYFDVNESASQLGSITELHRLHPDAIRSWHPTEPVSCIGPNADYFVGEHFGQLTPYNEKSPFYRVAEKKGKILMIGVTLDNAGTNLHTLEDAIADFKYPIYYPETFKVKIKAPDGQIHLVETKVHNPEWSKKRRCDELIPLFEREGALKHTQLGNAKCLFIDAKKMFDVMVEYYHKEGVTMYTPEGGRR